MIDGIIEDAQLHACIREIKRYKASWIRWSLVTLYQNIVLVMIGSTNNASGVCLLVVLCGYYLCHLRSDICHWESLSMTDEKILCNLLWCSFSPQRIHLILWAFIYLTINLCPWICDPSQWLLFIIQIIWFGPESLCHELFLVKTVIESVLWWYTVVSLCFGG